jgi:adenylate cyclase
LRTLNDELARENEPPLQIGIGIHTGPALVGCFGATLRTNDGQPRFRREFSAIGETVNLGQRIEQMTKQLGGPILISEATRSRLHTDRPLVGCGPQTLPGAPEAVVLHRVQLT